MENWFKELDESIEEVLDLSGYGDIIKTDVKVLIENYISNNFLPGDISKIIDKIMSEDARNEN